MHRISDEERRRRLVERHGLSRRTTVEEAVESVVCLHATEPHTVYLSLVARTDADRDEIGRALYADRTIVKQLAMRRTVFVFPRRLLPAAWGSASARVAQQLEARLAKEVEAAGHADDGTTWLRTATDAVLEELAEGPATTSQLRARIPALDKRLELAPGKSYGAVVPIANRLVGVLASSGRVLRGDNDGDWRLSRPRWTLTEQWLGEPPSYADPADGYRELVEAWLRRFGPGTEADIVWWLGATKAAVRRALADLDAVEVALESGTGYVLPDDLETGEDVEPTAALLPVLDPTVMGWKERGFYLDTDHVEHLFDRNGNAGTTAWWGGRVVGCWVQDGDAVVRVVPLIDLGHEARAALDAEAERLTAWLAGDKVSTVYPSALMKAHRPEA